MSDQQVDNRTYEFSEAEKSEIRKHIAKYPEKRSAVMPVLWMAQEKFGWLSQGAMELVARELGLSYAHVYGVASFYTMYFKRKVPKYLFDVCTCFTCGECGGDEILSFAKEHLKVDDNGFSEDGKFWIRPAECLAACDTAPVMQIANRRLVHNLTPDKFKEVVKGLQQDQMPPFHSIPMPDQSKFSNGGSTSPVTPPPVAETPPPSVEVETKSEEEE